MDTYDRILATINADNPASLTIEEHEDRTAFPKRGERVREVLMWLAYARRPMTLDELSLILSQSHMESDAAEPTSFQTDHQPFLGEIVRLCGPLAVCQPASKTGHRNYEQFRGTSNDSTESLTAWGEDYGTRYDGSDLLLLAHSSVRDWLAQRGKSLNHVIPDAKQAHEKVAKTSLSFVLTAPVDKTQPSFWAYAAVEWPYHVQKSPTPNTRSLAIKFIHCNEDRWGCWRNSQLEALRRRKWDDSYHTDPLPDRVYFASLYGLHWVIGSLIEAGYEIDAAGGKFRFPILAAIRSESITDTGRTNTVQELLMHGAKVNVLDYDYGSALGAAACRGHLDIVRLLVGHGAHVNASGGEYGSALGAATYEGHLDVIQLLVEHSADVNAFCREHGSVLGISIYKAHLDIVQFLVEHGADVNSPSGKQDTALGDAAYQGHLDIVKFLVEKGANVNRSCGKHGAALGAAAYHNHLDVVRYLVKQGADVNASDENHGSVLGAAACWGSPNVVQLLIEEGADVNASGGVHRSPLGVAAYYGNLGVVRLLQTRGANMEALDAVFGTALGVAAFGGWHEIVRFLLEKGANINVQSEDFGSILGVAITGGFLRVASELALWSGDSSWHDLRFGDPLKSIRVLVDILKQGKGGHNDVLAGITFQATRTVLYFLGARASTGGEPGEDLDVDKELRREFKPYLNTICLLIAHGADVDAPAGGIFDGMFGAVAPWDEAGTWTGTRRRRRRNEAEWSAK